MEALENVSIKTATINKNNKGICAIRAYSAHRQSAHIYGYVSRHRCIPTLKAILYSRTAVYLAYIMRERIKMFKWKSRKNMGFSSEGGPMAEGELGSRGWWVQSPLEVTGTALFSSLFV